MARGKNRREQSGILPFDVQEEVGPSSITAYAGLPMVAETFRACAADEEIAQGPSTRQRQRAGGYSDQQMAESLCLLFAAGGDHIDDIEPLRQDEGLAELMGYELPSPTRIKEYLYAFEDAMKAGRKQSASAGLFGSKTVMECGPIESLAAAVRATLRAVQACARSSEATLDLDASIVVSEKREATRTYTGESGYQPTLVYWAEQEMVVYDEFRDGNVPAAAGVLRVLKRAVEALPEGVEHISLRSDSAAYTHDLLNWCRDEADITFAVSADMSPQLREAIEAVPAQRWELLEVQSDTARSWAPVEFIPSAPSVVKGRRPDRYIAIRMEPVQRELFADGSEVKYFAIVTNDWERSGPELIQWQRGKAGTVEKLHDVLKNDLGAGVMPCGRFGANAAWLRLNVLTCNLLSLLRTECLPDELSRARPKRLRLWVFCRAGQLIHHARRLAVRVRWRAERFLGRLCDTRRQLLSLDWSISQSRRERASPVAA